MFKRPRSKVMWLSLFLVAAVLATTGIGVAVAKTSVAQPLPQVLYTFAFDGDLSGQFLSIEVLGCETDVVEYQDGEDRVLRKRPGRTRVGDFVLVSGLENPALDGFWTWYSTVIEGRVERKSGNVTISDAKGTVLETYDALHCWPCSWEVVNTEAGTVLEIGIACEQLIRQ